MYLSLHIHLTQWIKRYVSRQNGKVGKYSVRKETPDWWIGQVGEPIKKSDRNTYYGRASFPGSRPLVLKKRKHIQCFNAVTYLQARDVTSSYDITATPTAEMRSIYKFACICCAFLQFSENSNQQTKHIQCNKCRNKYSKMNLKRYNRFHCFYKMNFKSTKHNERIYSYLLY